MDLLLLYHRLPYPPNKGEKTRAYQQVDYLSRHHRLWVACFVDDEQDWAHVPAVSEHCHEFAAVPLSRRLALSRGGFQLLRGKTMTEGYFGHRGMWRVVQDWSEKHYFDVALGFSSCMGAYLEHIPAGRRVLDLVDFDSHKWSDFAGKRNWPVSALLRTEAHRLARREVELIDRVDLALVVNDREARRVNIPRLRHKLASFPTLMDLDHYAAVRAVPPQPVIGTLGTMDYPPNVESVMWFYRQVWPEVRQRHPQAEWWIVGRRPARQVGALAAQPGITVTGDVDDVRPYLAGIRVFAAPLQSEIGIPTKVLEAMACGRAVVTTTQGHQGVQGAAQQDYQVADHPAAFAAAVCTLLDDHEACTALGRRAVAFMQQHYDVSRRMPQFEQLLLGAAAPVHTRQ